ncbi:MAG: efflux RND transporter permease subunit [Candidatus Alcyoniella australis]|nr:efflux RND transporter permease subunit [Candidatus Alcyoniella australis]
MERCFSYVLRHRWVALIVLLLISLAAVASLRRAVFASSIGQMFLGEHPGYARYLERISEFGSDEVVLVAIEEDDALSSPGRQRLGRAVGAVRELPGVVRVRSLLDAQRVQGDAQSIWVRDYAALAEQDPGQIPQLIEQLTQDPFYGGLLVSDDGAHHAVIVQLQTEDDRPVEQTPELIQRILSAFTDAGYARESLHPLGAPVSFSSVVSESIANISTRLPLVAVLLLLTVWLMFRRMWPVLVTSLVAALASLWTMGFAVLLDPRVNILASMVPMVIMIIAFSDVVHLCSAYLLELGAGKSKSEAILHSGSDVGRACLMTSATTFVGFVSMSIVPAPIFRHLGLVLGFGVAVALLIAVTLVPILFSLIPQPKPWRRGAAGRVQDLLDRFLHGAAQLAAARPRTLIALFALLGLVAVYGMTRMHVETDFAKRLTYDHPLRVDARYFNAHFGGANSVDIYVDSGEIDGLLDPELIGLVAAYQRDLARLPGVTRVSSIVDLIAPLHAAIHYGQSAPGDLPRTRSALADDFQLLEIKGYNDLEQLIDFDRRRMRLTLQLPEEGVRATQEIGEQAARLGRQMLGEQADVEATGMLFLLGQWLGEIVAGQRRGLAFAVFTIALMMIIGLRSWRVGLWSMIPNLLPLAVLGGYLGLAWEQIDSDVLALMMIALGIGVDDTIHFLMRLRIEWKRHDDVEGALRSTFNFSGRGIVITTVILVVGFAPFALSDYLSVNMLGTLLPLTLIVALLADLLLLPALVKVGLLSFDERSQQ